MMLRGPLRANTVASRMARRELGLHKGRSALIVALVMLPLMVVIALSGTTASQVGSMGLSSFGSAVARAEALDGRDGRCVQSDLAWASCPSPEETAATPAAEATSLPSPDFSGVQSLGGESVTEVLRPAAVVVEGVDVDTQLAVVDLASPRSRERWLAQGGLQPAAGEVLAYRELADRFDLAPGDDISVDGEEYTVAGWFRTDEPSVGIVVGPQHPLAQGAESAAGADRRDLLYGNEPTLTQIHALNRQGVGVVTRQAFEEYNADADGTGIYQAILALMLAVATLLTSTIVGAAFSIGIRQQRRSLALLSASGAPGRVLKAVVVRQGLLLGMIGAGLGGLLGLAGAFGLSSWLDAGSSGMPNAFVVPWLLLVVSLLIGVGAAVLAAWLPARRIARQDVLGAVRDAETAQAPARLPWLGLVLLGLGMVVGVIGPRIWPSGGARYDGTVPVETVIGPGAVCVLLLFLAALLCMPWLLDQLGRHARGSLGWRLALRDGSRNRSRATATVAASMAIASLAGLLLVANQSMGQTDLDHYQYANRVGVGELSVGMGGEFTDETWQQARQKVQAVLPLAGDAPLRERQSCDQASGQCTNLLMVKGSESCDDGGCQSSGVGPRLYSDELFRVLVGRDATAAEKAVIARGGALGSASALTTPTAKLLDWERDGKEIPALVVADARGSWALVSEQAARQALPTGQTRTVGRAIDVGVAPTAEQVGRLSSEFSTLGRSAAPLGFGVEQGPHSAYLEGQRWVALGSAVLMLVVASLAGALALRDARPAHAGLAAIGASTRTLRSMAAVQTLVSVGLGSLLGLLVGALPMVLMVLASRGGVSLGVPWASLGALLVGVPVVAALAAFVLVRPPAARAVRVE